MSDYWNGVSTGITLGMGIAAACIVAIDCARAEDAVDRVGECVVDSDCSGDLHCCREEATFNTCQPRHVD